MMTNLTTTRFLFNLTQTTTSTTIHSTTNHTSYINDANISSLDIQQHIELGYSALGIFLALFCFITVFGNGLVIYAIVQERYLKSATYYYMASLACADLFVGLIVMPFGIVQVVYGDYWPFGKTCCDLWHSIDVCASTASILDLCVIALDRYSAITNPMSYQQSFFVRRWPYLLITVWLCSGLISFPAIAYWRLDVNQYQVHRCRFPDDIYYIVFSSLISFYIPLFVMIFVYIRIYRAAIKQLHAFKTGIKLTSPTNKKKKKGLKDQDTTIEQPPDICLRIHRGKYHGIPSSTRNSLTTLVHTDPTHPPNNDEHLNVSTNKSVNQTEKSISGEFLNNHQNSSLSRFSMPALSILQTPKILHNENYQLKVNNIHPKTMHSQETIPSNEQSRSSKVNVTSNATTSFGKRLTKFSKEQKATITLAYVMGIFVICWLPFFVYNPLTALAKLFIQPKPYLTSVEKVLTGSELVFQMFTWLGYVNSSVNPIIYAYSSREFRRAFIKYLCRCFPIRVRNLLMSYHNLHLLGYRRAPEKYISKDHVESGIDHNHINANKHQQISLVSSKMTTAKTHLNARQQQDVEYIHTQTDENKFNKEHSSVWFLTHCCKSTAIQQRYERRHKRSSSATSSKTTSRNNILVDYCTYHDVAISRVTCV